MRYQAIIFDLDGVICRTDQYHYLAWKQVADELGIPFDEQVNERLRGVSRMASFDIILERYDGTMSDEEKIHWTDKKNEIYKSMLTQMGPDDMLEDVADTLHKLRAMGLDLAIGSSSRNTKFILGQLGLSDFFDAISDGTNITHSKPDPEVFVKATELLNRAPAECLVVEDAEAGLQAATAGGMDSAAFGEIAIRSGLGTWNLERFSDLIGIVA